MFAPACSLKLSHAQLATITYDLHSPQISEILQCPSDLLIAIAMFSGLNCQLFRYGVAPAIEVQDRGTQANSVFGQL